MYIVPIAWIYVALMMSVAEATNSNGTVLGGIITFVLYGLLPVALVVYIMGTPGRKRRIKAQQEAELAAYLAAQSAKPIPPGTPGSASGIAPDAGSHAAADAVAPVGKEP